MPNFSSITISGHLGRDAELKQVGDSSVLEFSVAVSNKRKQEESTAWYRCAIWGKRGDGLAPHLLKGTPVIVSGELIPREYKNKEDELRTSLDIRVDQFSFAGQAAPREDAPAPAEEGGW